MDSARPILAALGFALLALAGIALLLIGGPESRPIAFACLLMFGVGGLAWLASELARSDPPRVGQVQLPSGATEPALIMPATRTRQRAAVIALGAFGSGALFLGLYPESLGDSDGPVTRLLLLGSGAVLILVVVAGLRSLRTRHMDLALSRSGLHQGGFVVRWDTIAGITPYEVQGGRYLGIDQVGNARAANAPRLSVLERVEARLTGFARTIALDGYAITPDATEAIIRDYFEHPDKRRTLGARVPSASGAVA